MLNWIDECFVNGTKGYASLQLKLKDGNKFTMNILVDKKYEGEYTNFEEYIKIINESRVENVEFLLSYSEIYHVELMGLLYLYNSVNENLKERMLRYINRECCLPNSNMLNGVYQIPYLSTRDITSDLIYYLTLNNKMSSDVLRYEMEKGVKRNKLFGKIYKRHDSRGGACYTLKWWKRKGVKLEFPQDPYTESYREKYKI